MSISVSLMHLYTSVNRVYLYSLFLWFFLFLFFPGEEGRKEKGGEGTEEKENHASVSAVTMQNKKTSMNQSPLTLF